MCYRKLVGVERDSEFNRKVFDFISETEGMPYILSTNLLFSQIKSNESAPKEGYFCSELVATIYQKLGLLSDELAPSSYWPGTFSTEKEDIQL